MRTATYGKILFFGQNNVRCASSSGTLGCSLRADGMWTLAEIAEFKTGASKWPSTAFTVNMTDTVVTLRCEDSAVFAANLTYDCGNEPANFKYTPAYFWERSVDNGRTWVPISQSSYNILSNNLWLGNIEDDAGVPSAVDQFYGYIDSFRLTVGEALYTTDLITPYNAGAPLNNLITSNTRLGINLGNAASRVTGSQIINIWTPTIGAGGDAQNVRVTTPPGTNVNWDALRPLTQSAAALGYQAQPAIQFVTSPANFESGGAFGSHYNYLAIRGEALSPQIAIRPQAEDCCYEGWVSVRLFLHSGVSAPAQPAGTTAVFFDTRSHATATDGLGIYFEPVNGVSSTRGNVVARIPYVNNKLSWGPLATNTWYHVALTKQSNTWRLYVNGILRDSFTSQLPILTIGGVVNADNGQMYRVLAKFGLRERYGEPVTLSVLNAVFEWDNAWYGVNFSQPYPVGFGYLEPFDAASGQILSIDNTDNNRWFYTVNSGTYTFAAKPYISNFDGGSFAYEWQTNNDPLGPDGGTWIPFPGQAGMQANAGDNTVPITWTRAVDAGRTIGVRLVVRCNSIESTSRFLVVTGVSSGGGAP